jgi:2-dehydro-3-deoxygluconokinase
MGGDQGAWYAEGAERGFCPCYPATEIDPVGAGDAFCAGLLSGLLDDQPLRQAVKRAAALGALCVSTFGDYQGLPDRLALQAFMEGSLIPAR